MIDNLILVSDLGNNRINGTLDLGSTQSNQLQSVNLQNNQISDFPQRGQYSTSIQLT